jgi:hypothetical protein
MPYFAARFSRYGRESGVNSRGGVLPVSIAARFVAVVENEVRALFMEYLACGFCRESGLIYEYIS